VRFVCDEGIDRSIVESLRTDGHEVFYVAESLPSISDDEVLEQANVRAAVLVTADKDFGELVFRLGKTAAGVLLVRLHDVPTQVRAALVSAAVGEHGHELPGSFAVLSSTKLRIRKQL
jgi:predicted nuclease of predicted toxin-antitoxin system